MTMAASIYLLMMWIW